MSDQPQPSLREEVVEQAIEVVWRSAITEELETILLTIQAPRGAFWGAKDTLFRLSVDSGTKSACDEYVARMARHVGRDITHITTLDFFRKKIEQAGKQQRDFFVMAIKSSWGFRFGLRKKRLEDIPELPIFRVLRIQISPGHPDNN